MHYLSVLMILTIGSFAVANENPCTHLGFFALRENSPDYYGCYANKYGDMTKAYLRCSEGQVFAPKSGICQSSTLKVNDNINLLLESSSNSPDIENPTIPTFPTDAAQSTNEVTVKESTAAPAKTTTETEKSTTEDKNETEVTTVGSPESTLQPEETETTTTDETSEGSETTEDDVTTSEGPEKDTTTTDSEEVTTEGSDDDTTTTEEVTTEGSGDKTTTTEEVTSTTTAAPVKTTTTTKAATITETPEETTTESSETNETTESNTTTTEEPAETTISTSTEESETSSLSPMDSNTTQSTPDESETTTSQAKVFSCPTTGFFPRDGSCDQFIYCAEIDGEMKSYVKACPKGQNYNPSGGYCTSEFNCGAVTSSPTRKLNTFECLVEGTFVYHNDCSRYYKCVWDNRVQDFKSHILKCPNGDVYHTLTGKCGPEEAVTCKGRNRNSKFHSNAK